MTINTTTWSLDTCACVLEYEWDDSLPDTSRVHTVTRIISSCAAHSTSATIQDHFNIVMDENPRKNNAYQHLIDTFPAQLSSTGAAGGKLKDGITFNFSLSGTAPNRVLTISYTGITLTAPQKTAIQTALNNRFGSGKVVIA